MSYAPVYKKTESYVTEMFHKHQSEQLVFHNLEHTKGVVKRAVEIAGHYHLSEEDMMIIFVSAWFHDTGYLFENRENHELKSVELMRKFAEQTKLPEEIAEKMAGCIMATRFPRNPVTPLEEILSDADTYQFGSKKDFKTTNKLAFAEEHYHCGIPVSKKDFDEGTLKMLKGHQFYTAYCRENLDGEKKEIMKKIKKDFKAEDNYKDDVREITEKDGTTKGMQTMLRLTSSNHMQLSEMADNKANILISVNAIIISVILSVLLRKLQTDPYLAIPTIIFLSFSVITIVVAILATRPKLNTGNFEDEDIINKKTNLLFFGNFHKTTQEKYENAMRTMMKDSDYLYSSIIQDIFHLGQALGKKYRLIRWAYNIFMVGIIVSVVAFGIAAMFHMSAPVGVVPNSSGSPF